MNSISPISKGFGLVFRRPAIASAEIAWRWSVAAAAWALGALFIFEYLDSLPVRRLDRLLLYTGQPFLIAQALRRIFAGSSFRFIEGGIFVALCLTVAWIFLSSLGRLAITRSVLDEYGIPAIERRDTFGSLLFLNFLRAALTLAALTGFVGIPLITSSFWASTHIDVGEAARIVFLLWFLTGLAWIVLNWLLSSAGIFTVAVGAPAFSAVGMTLGLLRTETAPMLATGVLFCLIHGGAFVAVAGAVLSIAPLVMASPAALVVIILIALAYFAFADVLFTARLAAYVWIARGNEAAAALVDLDLPPPSGPETRSSPVDQDELILSDAPQPAF